MSEDTREAIIQRFEAALVQMRECSRYTPEDVDQLESAAWDVFPLLEAQEPGWISVEDRWPDLEGDYLVTDGHEIPWRCRMIKLGGVKAWVNTALNPRAKYWMPLPEPPKEG